MEHNDPVPENYDDFLADLPDDDQPDTDPAMDKAFAAQIAHLNFHYHNALHAFASSPSPFQILRTITKPWKKRPEKPAFPKAHEDVLKRLAQATAKLTAPLYILDSSFNPPTKAHLRLAASAIASHEGEVRPRLLLLLATQNADKAPKPADFEHRLTMMTLMADALQHEVYSKSDVEPLAVDIGVTKKPYFVDKAKAIRESGYYSKNTEQVHLIGFDTFMRLLDTKYYEGNTLKGLADFWEGGRVRVSYRVDDKWGDVGDQNQFLMDMREGKLDEKGGRREWAEKVEMVGGRREGQPVISSTRVREAIASGDERALRELVVDRVATCILSEKMYTDEVVVSTIRE